MATPSNGEPMGGSSSTSPLSGSSFSSRAQPVKRKSEAPTARADTSERIEWDFIVARPPKATLVPHIYVWQPTETVRGVPGDPLTSRPADAPSELGGAAQQPGHGGHPVAQLAHDRVVAQAADDLLDDGGHLACCRGARL